MFFKPWPFPQCLPLTTLTVALTAHFKLSLVSTESASQDNLQDAWFFCTAMNCGECGVSCYQQGSSSHHSVQIACKLFNSHSVANKIGHSVGSFLPAGMDTPKQTWRQCTTTTINQANTNFTWINTVCKYNKSTRSILKKMHLCNHKEDRDLICSRQ